MARKPKVFTSLYWVLVLSSPRQMVLIVEFLMLQVQALRPRVKDQVRLTPGEKAAMVKLGRRLSPMARKELVKVVSPRTFDRWLSRKRRRRVPNPAHKPGRPRTPKAICDLLLRLARENAWGYTRTLGEFMKLRFTSVSRTTVKNVLKANGIHPDPRGPIPGRWDDFIVRHVKTLWACDFLCKKVWTPRGLVDYFVILFIHVESRRIWISPGAERPTSEWSAQQARNFAMHVEDQGLQITHLIRDRDSKFGPQFDMVLQDRGIAPQRTCYRAPNMNAFAERAIQTLEVECLDHFVVFGRRHLDYIVAEFVAHYNTERPHQSKGNAPLTGPSARGDPTGAVRCRKRLGGLLRHYYRAA